MERTTPVNDKFCNFIVLYGRITFRSPLSTDADVPRVVCEVEAFDAVARYQCVAVGATAKFISACPSDTFVTLHGRLRSPAHRRTISFLEVDRAEAFRDAQAFRLAERCSNDSPNPLVRIVGVVRQASSTRDRFGCDQLELTVEIRTFKGARLACDHHRVQYVFLRSDLQTHPLPALDDIVEITGGLIRDYSHDSRGRSVPHDLIAADSCQLVARRRRGGADADQKGSIVAFPQSSSRL
jgi:hypothetical protein